MRDIINLLETAYKLAEARRISEPEFIKLAQQKLGPKAAHISLADLIAFAAANDVAMPLSIRRNTTDLKVNPHIWNLSGRSADDASVDDKVAKDLGVNVEPAAPGDDAELRLANVQKVRNLVATGKIYMFGRKQKGAFFRIQGADEMLASLERAFSRELASQGATTMEEQYDDLRERVGLVASGRSSRLKSLLLTGAPRSGKALALDTPIPTPTGWTIMGELMVGDTIYDENGETCKVTFATDVQLDRNCYEIEFDDGTKIIADEDHRWLTTTVGSRQSEKRSRKDRPLALRGTDQSHKRILPVIVTTKEISNTIRCSTKFNHQIINTLPIVGLVEDDDLPVNPYVLGIWLGDGCAIHATMSCGIQDIDELRKNLDLENTPFKDTLTSRGVWHIQLSNGYGGKMKEKLRYKFRELGILGDKHIPQMYLRASVKMRAELLKGLMDSDGTISKMGNCEFCVTNKHLAIDVLELIRSLGIRASFDTDPCKLEGRDMGERYRILFTTTKDIFRLPRKANRQNAKVRKENSVTIVGCNPVASVPVRCITVDSPSHLFLCSKAFVPTHNTFTVMETLAKLGYKEDTDFIVQKGKSTPVALYKTMIEQLHGLTVYDDCDSIIDDEDGVNMLKNALDSSPIRDVGYNNPRGTINVAVLPREDRNKYVDIVSKLLKADSITPDEYEFMKNILKKLRVFGAATKGIKKSAPELEVDDDENEDDGFGEVDANEMDAVSAFAMIRLPNKIDYDGRMIFISNLTKDDWPEAVTERAFVQNMNFRDDEMLDYIDKIKNNIPMAISNEEKQEVWDLVRDLWKTGKLKSRVSFGLAFEAFDLRLTTNWKRMVSQL